MVRSVRSSSPTNIHTYNHTQPHSSQTPVNGLPDDTPTWTHIYDATGDYLRPDTIIVKDTVLGKWAAGADIVVASHTNIWDDHQARVIAAVIQDVGEPGYVGLKLDEPILRPTTIKESPDFATEVALLSRNIVLQGDPNSPQFEGGHLMIFHTPTIQQSIEGVDVQNFGQQGTLGRYPIHFHLCREVDGAIVAKNTM